jgi:GAF domain-containing protein
MVKKAPSAAAGERARNSRRGGGPEATTTEDPAASRQLIAELRRQLAECRAEPDEAREYQTATSDVLKVIARSTADVQPVLDTVAETAARLCGADGAGITIRGGEIYRYVAATQAEAADAEFWAALRQRTIVPSRETLAGRVLLEGRVVQIADIRADPDFAVPESVATGHRTGLGVPLLREGAVLGTINLNRKRVEPFTERQIELVRTFADQAVIAIENARLLTETREALERQTATAEILRVISSSPTDVQPTFDAIAAAAKSLTGALLGSVLTYDGEQIEVVAWSGWTPEEFAKARSVFPIPADRGTTTGRAIVTRAVAHIEDVATDPEFAYAPLADMGGHTSLAVPMLRDGEPIGAILVQRRDVQRFSDKQIDLLKTFADQAVIAIENVRLFNELNARTRDLEESLEYQTATSDVLKVISRSTSDVQPVLDTVVETAARLCGADSATVAIRKGEVYRYVASARAVAADPEWWVALRQRTIHPGRDSLAGRVALEGRVVHVADIRADPDWAIPETVTGGVRTGLGVPLLREGAVIGTINLGRIRVQPFTEPQIELVRTFADQAVIAIENARLLGELQARTRDLEESLEYQTATSDVLNVISRSTADVQPVLDTVAETACRLCDSDTAAIFVRDGEVYRAVANNYVSAVDAELWTVLRQHRYVPGRDTITGRVALEGKIVHVADVLADPDYASPAAVAAGRRTILGVPLLREGAVLGTINLARKRVEPFTERQIELVRTFADQAVIAMENARLLGELQARTRDLEESLEYQTATSNVLQVISRSTADVQPVLDTVAETTARLCSADRGTILIREGEVYRVVSISTSAADPEFWAAMRQQTFVRGRDSVVARVALEGRVVHIPDVRADPDYAFPGAAASGRRTMLGVPLLRETEPIGIISLSRNRAEPFSERQIELVRTFADQAVIAIENARLLTELRESLEQQTATAEVLQVINSSPGELQPVFEAILEKARTHCGATRGALFLFDGETFQGVAAQGVPQDWTEQQRRGFNIRQVSYWAPLLAGAPFVHIADMRLIDNPTARAAAERGLRTNLLLALRKDGALLGLIGCGRYEVRPFSAKEIASWKTSQRRRSLRWTMPGCWKKSAGVRPSCASPLTIWATGSRCSTPSSGSRRGTAISSSFSICPTRC